MMLKVSAAYLEAPEKISVTAAIKNPPARVSSGKLAKVGENQ
ncbi:MAG: hypothetical protein ACKOQ2_32590 [Dolichospermum sp.]